MGGNYQKDIYKQLMELTEKFDALENDFKMSKLHESVLKDDVNRLTGKTEQLTSDNQELRQQMNSLTEENVQLREINEKLAAENAKLKSDKNNNSNNTSLPPSTDEKPAKKANEYNGRKKSGRKAGAQPGHKGRTLTQSDVEDKIRSGKFNHEVTEQRPDDCESTQYRRKYVIDFAIVPIAKEIRFYADKNGRFHIPPENRSDVIYGPVIRSLAVDLYSEGNVSIERIHTLINSLSGGLIDISEGSIYGFCNAFSKLCRPSRNQIDQELLSSPTLYTDATVVSTDGVQSYIRSLSSQKAVRYFSMSKKSIPALKKLELLPVYTGTLVHDHETAMYHFGTGHGECNVHVIRYLRKNSEDTHNSWSDEMIVLLSEANKKVKEYLLDGHFITEQEADAICSSYDELLEKGYEQNKTTTHKYAKKDEHTLLNRLKKYRDNHLLFLKDSNVKFHNNDSESLLRKCKSHQKMTGGFRKESGGELYCNIMSIIETCKIKNMSVFDSIMEIFTGNRAIY